MKNKVKAKIKNILLLKTIRAKIIVTCIIFSTIILFSISMTATSEITHLEEKLISNRLSADINYVEDLISNNSETSDWNIKDNAIYFGDVLIGDGSEEKANLEPFLKHEQKTGTFAYVFILDKDAKLGYVEGNDTAAGYMQGHYLRVAGSTKSPSGESIVGNYISKNVSDSLDSYGSYSGEANVAGGSIFCLYKVLKNKSGETIGAIVVGRNITELKAQISNSVNYITVLMVGIVIVSCTVIIFLISRWISSIGIITDYLKKLEYGNIPENNLKLETQDEMLLISESINKMVNSMKENIILRKKSETDALTNLPNRFAYDYYAKEIYNKLAEQPDYLALEILDIDHFKEYNDNYGHQAGDKCIKILSEELRKLCQEHSNIFCCRYGGDEFILIYDGYSKSEIETFINLLKERIKACNIKHEYSSISDIVTITQGVCLGFFKTNYSISDYLNKADKALYAVKKINRGHYALTDMS